ncbi:MAG: hypothetical protein HYX87_04335 [Chloroflexi bacterium]|nr:hypothetical protein [Chloroflexota bacterium]
MTLRDKNQSAAIRRWEAWGILFIVLLGALLHFTFELSGGWTPLGAISAVNESVWEHLKLAFWPAVLWTIVEYFLARHSSRDTRPNFLLARAVGTYTMPVVIVAIFYSYTALTGDSILAVDLSSFVLAVAMGQMIGYRLWDSLRLPQALNWLGLAMLAVAAMAFVVFTFFTPEAGVFRDPVTGSYGIAPK